MRKWGVLVGLVSVGMLAACQSMKKETALPQQEVVKKSEIDWNQAAVDAKKNKISFEKVKKDVGAGAKFYDVRSKDEYEAGNFGITENLSLTYLQAGKLPDLPKDTKIYVHCQSGRRSALATNILRDAGFTQVFDMGGLANVQAIGGVLE